MIEIFWSDELNDYAFIFHEIPIFLWCLNDKGERRCFRKIYTDFQMVGEM